MTWLHDVFDRPSTILCADNRAVTIERKIKNELELINTLNTELQNFNCWHNPIRSGVFKKVNDPGGGALKSPPPPPLRS